jgi:hypothetical protein
VILDDPGTFVKNEIEPIEPILRDKVPQSGDDQTAESSADFAGFDFEALEQGA